MLTSSSEGEKKSNKPVQRTGASRFAQRQIERRCRLAPVADLYVRRRAHIMRFLKPTLSTALPPLVLVALAVVPVLPLRYTVYEFLAAPLTSLIQQFGWVYQDKPMFLTYPGAVFTAAVWALPLFLLLCIVRHCFSRR